jgi:hypothetical protein
MDKAFSILMWALSVGLLLYAGLLLIFKETELIPKYYMAHIEDKRTYAVRFAFLIMLVAAAPAISGVVAFFGEAFMIPAFIVLIAGVVGAIIIGVKFIMPKE